MSAATKNNNLNTRTAIAGFKGLYSRSNKILIKFRFEGKTHYQTTGLEVSKPNIRAAVQKLADIETQISMGIFDFTQAFPNARKSQAVVSAGTQTITDAAQVWFERWKEHNPTASPNTVNTYKYCVKHHLKGLDVCAVNKITPAMLKAWYGELRNIRTGEKLSTKRKLNIITTARHVFIEAASSGLFDGASPFLEFESWLKSLDGKKATAQFESIHPELIFARAEIDQLLAYGAENPTKIHPNDLNMVGFNLSCGLRLGELFGLTWDCIDFEAKTILVRAQITEGSYQRLKTYNERTLELSNDAIKYLKKQQAITRMLEPIQMSFLTNEVDKKGMPIIEERLERFVFLNPAFDMGRPYYRSDSFGSRWYNMLKASGVPSIVGKSKRNRTANTMRHTFASRLLTAGAPIELVARQLGNTPPACKKHYARIIPSEQKIDNHDMINALLAGGSK